MIPILADGAVDQWEHYSFVATVFSAIFTAWWAIRQWREEAARRREDQEAERAAKREELRQREYELRWKQAELARKMMDAIFDYPPSNDAWRMVDGEETYKADDGKDYQIDMDLVRRALPQPWNDKCSGPEVYARWCFDALLYYLEQIEQALDLDILRFEDVESTASYYVALMAKDKKLFEDYTALIRFRRGLKFLQRFPEWQDAGKQLPATP